MLIFDELKKNDPQLRLVAIALVGGLFLLVARLWWVQIVASNDYENSLETQAVRTVRVPAIRGKIMDHDGRVLAENRPRYNLSLYLDELRKQFESARSKIAKQAIAAQRTRIALTEKKLGRSLNKTERQQYQFNAQQTQQWRDQAYVQVAASVISQVSQWLGQPLPFDTAKFLKHYATQLAMPYTILPNLDDTQMAHFQEHYTGNIGADVELQSVRNYPFGSTAALLLGYVSKDDSSIAGEEAFYNYRLPDYSGKVGIEGGFDAQLHGRAGGEAVLVNSLGYRQSENVLEEPDPGDNVVLTIDLDVQQAAEKSLLDHQGPNARSGIVVMDVHTGDILAMVSSPALNPAYYVGNLSPEEFQKETALKNDPKLMPEINRATQGSYIPGSVFKPIVALAALENGLNPNEKYEVQADPTEPWHGCIYVGKRKVKDTVPPGSYDLRRAIEQSSNSYFIFNGLRTGIDKIVALGKKLHLGDRMNLPTRQEDRGNFPTPQRVQGDDWRDGDSANICFGQGEVSVTPMQMAVAYSAIANGGKVLWPRLVERIEPQDPSTGEKPTVYPSGVVRDEIGVSRRSFKVLFDAMMSETEDTAGTGYNAFHQKGEKLNIRVCGKTGTAQRKDEHGQMTGWNYWFCSFAPYENPRWAVIVMVQSENRGSGGIVCAPIAHDIYEAILEKENSKAQQNMARTK